MKRLSFVVTLTLSDTISGDDTELREMAEKIGRALEKQCQSPTMNENLMPDGSDERVTNIGVSYSGILFSELEVKE